MHQLASPRGYAARLAHVSASVCGCFAAAGQARRSTAAAIRSTRARPAHAERPRCGPSAQIAPTGPRRGVDCSAAKDHGAGSRSGRRCERRGRRTVVRAAAIWLCGVLEKEGRTPTLLLALPGAFRLRFAERQFLALLFQDPPRFHAVRGAACDPLPSRFWTQAKSFLLRLRVFPMARYATMDLTQSASFFSSISPHAKARSRARSRRRERRRFWGRTRIVPR